MIIYIVKNKINNKIYIGQTRNDLKKRWQDHLGASRRGSLAPIHQAIRKYGVDCFVLEILYSCNSLEEMDAKEIEFIKQMAPQYNIHHGGNTSFSKEHSQRVKDAMQRPDVVAKISKVKTDPTINKKLRDALKHKVHGDEKIVKQMIAGGMQFAKSIKAVNIVTKEEFIFASQREAERKLCIPNSSIRKVLKGMLKQSHNYCFEYIA